MSSDATQQRTVYAWLSCPECESRAITRGPRNDRGAVYIECEACGAGDWVGL